MRDVAYGTKQYKTAPSEVRPFKILTAHVKSVLLFVVFLWRYVALQLLKPNYDNLILLPGV